MRSNTWDECDPVTALKELPKCCSYWWRRNECPVPGGGYKATSMQTLILCLHQVVQERGTAPCAHPRNAPAPARSNAEEPSRANWAPDSNLKLQSVLCSGAGGAVFLKNVISTYLEEDPWLFSMPSACGQSARAARAAAAWRGISRERAAITNVAIGKGETQDNVPRGQNQLLW